MVPQPDCPADGVEVLRVPWESPLASARVINSEEERSGRALRGALLRGELISPASWTQISALASVDTATVPCECRDAPIAVLTFLSCGLRLSYDMEVSC